MPPAINTKTTNHPVHLDTMNAYLCRLRQLTEASLAADNELNRLHKMFMLDLRDPIAVYVYERGGNPSGTRYQDASQQLYQDIREYLEECGPSSIWLMLRTYVLDAIRGRQGLGYSYMAKKNVDVTLHHALVLLGNLRSNGQKDESLLPEQFRIYQHAREQDQGSQWSTPDAMPDRRDELIVRPLLIIREQYPNLLR